MNELSDHKPCSHCGQELTRRAGERAWHFRKRRFCDQTCVNNSKKSAGVEIQLSQPRHCLHCNRPLVRRPNERHSGFKARTHCDLACANARRNNEPVDFTKLKPTVLLQATAVEKRKARKKVIKTPSFVDRFDSVTWLLFVEALDVHPEFLAAFANRREFDYSDELRAGDFLKAAR